MQVDFTPVEAGRGKLASEPVGLETHQLADALGPDEITVELGCSGFLSVFHLLVSAERLRSENLAGSCKRLTPA